MHESESWTLIEKERNKAYVFERNILKKIWGLVLEKGTLGITKNKEICDFMKQPNLVQK